jgi:hypothetical protein
MAFDTMADFLNEWPFYLKRMPKSEMLVGTAFVEANLLKPGARSYHIIADSLHMMYKPKLGFRGWLPVDPMF